MGEGRWKISFDLRLSFLNDKERRTVVPHLLRGKGPWVFRSSQDCFPRAAQRPNETDI